jgi:hypothetical protein
LERLRIHQGSLPNLLQSFDNDSLTRLQAFENDPVAAHSLSELHGPYRNPVGAIDYGELMRSLQIDDCLLRYKEGTL